MSQLLGKELTEALLKRLSGQDVKAHEGKIIPIFTLDESGWPHPALLSYYEVVAKELDHHRHRAVEKQFHRKKSSADQ